MPRYIRNGLIGGAGVWAVLGLVVMLGLAACATSSPQSALFVACRGYADALTALQPFKPQMAPGEIAVINQSIEIAKPLCSSDSTANPQTAVDTVRAYLRQLVAIQQARGIK
jgi:hypothetical protein